jgi:hypothetical protein
MNNEPVAWAMFKGDTFMDAIHPDEHTRFEGGYTIPLYTHPAKELDEQFKKGFEAGKEEGWKAHKFHHPAKTLTDEEIGDFTHRMVLCCQVHPSSADINVLGLKFIVEDILRKAQDK